MKLKFEAYHPKKNKTFRVYRIDLMFGMIFCEDDNGDFVTFRSSFVELYQLVPNSDKTDFIKNLVEL